jgi:hypothetical protein
VYSQDYIQDDKHQTRNYDYLNYESFLELIARLALEVYAANRKTLDEHIGIEYKVYRLMDLLYEQALIKTQK